MQNMHYFTSFLLFSMVFLFSTSEVFSYEFEIPLPRGMTGPEAVAFDCRGGGPYVGVSNGSILRWNWIGRYWSTFAFTKPVIRRQFYCTNTRTEPDCGRPLGLKFHPTTCELFIADAYVGLMKVGEAGGRAQLLANTTTDGVAFKFTNGLDIDADAGAVYFTDSSSVHQRRDYAELIQKNDTDGRLLRYDLVSQQVTVMYEGLRFPNGVALSSDNSFLLVAESNNNRILKFNLNRNAKTYTPHIFIDNLPRFPDNIKRNSRGLFWVSQNYDRERTSREPVGILLDNQGRQVWSLPGEKGLRFVSEVEEHNRWLYVGSPKENFLGVVIPYL